MTKTPKRTRIKMAALALMACFLLNTTAWAATKEEKPTADLSVSFLSQYIWRGFEYSQDSMVIQPSMTIGYKGFAFNLWGNLDTDTATIATDNWNETDMTTSYDWSTGPANMSVGYIYYALDGTDDSQEIFLSAGIDTLLNPTITIYREIWHAPSWYVTLDISHSIPVTGDLNLDLGAEVSYLYSDDEGAYYKPSDPNKELRDFHSCLLSASTTIPVAKHITITPEMHYSFALGSDSSDLIKERSIDGNDDNFFYGGITVSLAI